MKIEEITENFNRNVIERMLIIVAIREAEIILGDLEHEMCCRTAGEILNWPDDVEHGIKIWDVYVTMKPSRFHRTIYEC